MCSSDLIKIGHVMDDVLHYHAHTLFAWSLMRVGNDGDMETSVPTANHLPPSHGDDVQASRTTLFEGGGDDAAQPTSITMTSHPTHAKSP